MGTLAEALARSASIQQRARCPQRHSKVRTALGSARLASTRERSVHTAERLASIEERPDCIAGRLVCTKERSVRIAVRLART